MSNWYRQLFLFGTFTFEALGGLVLMNATESQAMRMLSVLMLGSGMFGMAATGWQAFSELNQQSPGAEAGDRTRHEHTTDSPGSGNLL